METMQLHIALLCLDCEEIHDQQTCPVCSSESFAYISRWIPAPERRRTRHRAQEAVEAAEFCRKLRNPGTRAAGKGRWVKRGVLGLTAVGIAGWALRRK